MQNYGMALIIKNSKSIFDNYQLVAHKELFKKNVGYVEKQINKLLLIMAKNK
jgi:hypothetical protein